MELKKKRIISIAIDGNEANTHQRVGSNVYAYELLSAIEKLTRNQEKYQWTILLSSPPIKDLPKKTANWHYLVIKPKHFWTQWTLPIHLFTKKGFYDLLLSPGHYAPRFCPIPYINTVMDTAFLTFPKLFKVADLIKLTHWTHHSVMNAQAVIAISQATKKAINFHYQKSIDQIEVVYPALPSQNLVEVISLSQQKNTLEKFKLDKDPFILFVGTLQPRKNLESLITAFEICSKNIATKAISNKRLNKNNSKFRPPKLVLTGKVGWLAEDILNKINNSPLAKRIVVTGYLTEKEKQILYQRAGCSTLIGLYEGFGIPALEALAFGTIPVVSNTTSLPEVVGDAGILVDPSKVIEIADGLLKALTLSAKERAILRKNARLQLKKFSWDDSAVKVVTLIEELT